MLHLLRCQKTLDVLYSAQSMAKQQGATVRSTAYSSRVQELQGCNINTKQGQKLAASTGGLPGLKVEVHKLPELHTAN